MHIGIVERIAADYLRLVVTVAGAEGDAVDLAPGHRQVEHLLPGRGGSRFERIHHGRPRNGHLAVSGELRGEGLHRQRLHYIR